MYDFSKIPSAINLTSEVILSKISEETIFTYYFGQPIKLGKSYNSIFDKDVNPSTWFFRNVKGKLLYFDCRSGIKYDVFGFVKKLFNCSFQEALFQIAQDFGLVDGSYVKISKELYKQSLELEKQSKAESVIQFIPEIWTDKALSFWKQYEITKKELEEDEIFLIKKLYVNKVEIFNPNNQLRFAYIEKWKEDDILKTGVKIYSPYDKNMKWVSSIPLHVPFGLNNLPLKHDTLWITKSKKDRLILKKFFPEVIATQNESEAALSLETQEFALLNYNKRIINFDADDTGVTNCKKFNNKGFDYFNTPKKDYLKYGIKDVSDYVKAYNLDLLEELLKKYNLL